MKIDTSQWKEFLVSDIFECNTTTPVDINFVTSGEIPYITRSNSNNGCSNYIGNSQILNKGNCITIGAEGKVAFYQKDDFIAGVKIYTLRNSAMNIYVGLFLVTILNTQTYLYSYGRARVLEKIKKEIIKLPEKNGMPDYKYMENYIKGMHHKEITTAIKIEPLNFSVNSWREFALRDLFNFVKGKRLTKQDMIEGNTNYLGAISVNNGIRQHIEVDNKYINKPNCITVNYNGSVGESFYQHEPFWASDDVNILYPKGWSINKYIAMFICTVIKANRFKFSYGRKWTLEKMKESLIKLPAKNDGTPDFQYMENYIKTLPYSDRI